ncbi:hypothetical protein CWO07_13060 [Vibrio splendidus]|uniref:Uncharacterized protein n=1 Tax=Vibrio splendidus TaxID=29497 RepID=A0A2T5EV38_VIBSP|nr:hypothetical protein CWO07_13060 [Vibrio splendidus]
MCVEEKIFEIRDTRYEIRDTRYEIRDTRYEIFLKNRGEQASKNAKHRGAIFQFDETKKAELMLGFLY